MAAKPAKGKLCQGLSFKQGEVRLSKPSGKMWMKPVARMTPAAKALMIKKTSLSGEIAGIHLPRIGRQTPMAPATRMEKTAMIFRGRALDLSRPSSSEEQSQSAWAKRGRRSSEAMKKMKMKDDDDDDDFMVVCFNCEKVLNEF